MPLELAQRYRTSTNDNILSGIFHADDPSAMSTLRHVFRTKSRHRFHELPERPRTPH